MMEIRPLEHNDDLQVVGQLYVDSWQQTYQRILPQHFLDRLTPDRWSAVLAAEPENWLGLFVDETLKGFPVIRSYNSEEDVSDQFKGANERYYANLKKSQ